MNAPMTNNLTVAEHVSKEKLIEDLRVVVADAEELLRATANQAGDQIAAVRVKVNESLRSAKQRLAEARSSTIDSVKVAAKASDNFVHENPWRSVGIAAVAGLLLGVVIARR